MKLSTTLAPLLAASASGAVVSLNPIEDAFVSAANANSNYGGAGALAVAAAGLPKGEFDSLLKFDLSTAKTSLDATFGAGLWAIDSITLQLTTSAPNNAIFNANSVGAFSIKWMQSDSWVEGSGTPAAPGGSGIMFATLPSFLSGADEPLGSFSFGGGTSGNNTWNLGLATSFAADATAGNTVSLLMLPADSAVGYVSNSRSFGTVASRPLLTVNASATPEPGASALLAASAAIWLVRRRRKHERTA